MAGLVTAYQEHVVAQFLSCVATYLGNWAAFFQTAGTWLIEGGTKRLIDAIMADSKAEVHLCIPVAATESSSASAPPSSCSL